MPHFKSQKGPLFSRQAVNLEWLLYARTAVGADSCVIVAARYENIAGTRLDQQTLFPALRHLVRQNAALSARLVSSPDARRPPSWVRLTSLDLDDVVQFVNDEAGGLDAAFARQFTRGFNIHADLPLWRLAFNRDGTVLLAFDRVLGDGKSGLAIHKMLLDALNKQGELSASDDGKITDLPQDTTLSPSLEETNKLPIPVLKLLGELLSMLNPFAWRRYFAMWSGNPVPASFELPVSVRILQYTPSETAHLLQLVRSHSATLTSTLHTLVLVILSRLIHARELGGSHKYATTVVPVSLRRFTGAGANDICNHYSFYYPQNKLFSASALASDSFPWEDATRFAQTLKRGVRESMSAMGVLRIVSAVGAPESFVRSPLGRRRLAAIEVSNVGAFYDGDAPPPEADDNPWMMRETVFALADGTLGAALKVGVIGGSAGVFASP
ncbi:alcohol acetyltransferase [Cerioporus squamosus]|nr:alcohol acetyltransferase [Cerioporus squamosus]